MSSIADKLMSMELLAQRAIVQELRILRAQLRSLQTELQPSDLEHANALLLRLDHLEAQQTAPLASRHEPPRYLAPDLVIDASPEPAQWRDASPDAPDRAGPGELPPGPCKDQAMADAGMPAGETVADHRCPEADLQRLAGRVATLMASGLAPLDAELLQALADLGSQALSIVRLASEHARLRDILRGLHAYNLLDATGTESDGALAALKRRARRAAADGPSAPWDPRAEGGVLETLPHATDEAAPDRAMPEPARAHG